MSGSGIVTPHPEKRDFYITSETKEKLIATATLALGKHGGTPRPQNILVKGMQGCGKSELAEQFAATLKRPYFATQIGLLAESGQIFGQQTLKKGDVVYESFQFIEAIQTENIVILLDEINRVENPKALNALFSILDDRRCVWLDELGKMVTVAEGVIFFATINEGAEFTGTELMDAAMSDRFFVLEMGNIPEDKERELFMKRLGLAEDKATELSNLLQSARRNDLKVSTRKALQVAELLTAGLGIRSAFEFSLGLEKEKLEKILLAVHFSRDDEMQEGALEWTTL